VIGRVIATNNVSPYGGAMADPDDEKAGSQIVPDSPGPPNPKPSDTPTPEDEAKADKSEDRDS
jgi:hypothetical protein